MLILAWQENIFVIFGQLREKMALGAKYSRIEAYRFWNCYSTVKIAGFAVFCLVGAWMFMSLSIGPYILNDAKRVVSDSTQTEFGVGSDGDDVTVVRENKLAVNESSNDEPESEFDRKEDLIPSEVQSGLGEANVRDKDKDSNEREQSYVESEVVNDQIKSVSTEEAESQIVKESQEYSLNEDQNSYHWKLCNTTAGPDYIPCLDNWQAIRRLPSTKHYEHRERHCPGEVPTCLVPLPKGYRQSIEWPQSRNKVLLCINEYELLVGMLVIY